MSLLSLTAGIVSGPAAVNQERRVGEVRVIR